MPPKNRRSRSDGFLTNILAVNAEHIQQAAIDTKMPVSIGESSQGLPNTVGVYTEQPTLEHGPFWRRYDELKKEAKTNDQKCITRTIQARNDPQTQAADKKASAAAEVMDFKTSVEAWQKVIRALSELYQVWAKHGSDNDLTQEKLNALMQLYDGWLD